VFVVAGAIVGEVYTDVILMPTIPEQRIWLPGARAGAMIAGTISGLEIFFIHDRYGGAFRRLPFLLFLGLRVAAHTSLVVVMLAVNARIGMWLGESFAIDMLQPRQLVRNTVFSLVMFTVALFTGQMRSLIGGRALTNVLLGRYYRPRHEERLFILLDVKGSTPLSVRLGDKQFHELLSAVFFDVDAPITDHRAGRRDLRVRRRCRDRQLVPRKGQSGTASYRGSIRRVRRGAPALRMVSAEVRGSSWAAGRLASRVGSRGRMRR
jgi:hypothetical protein